MPEEKLFTLQMQIYSYRKIEWMRKDEAPQTVWKIKDLFYDNVKYVQELKNTEKLAHTFTTSQ